MSKPLEEIEVYFLYQTDHAILVNIDGSEDGVWLPKSQIEWAGSGDPSYDLTRRNLTTIKAPEWLLMDKGLI